MQKAKELTPEAAKVINETKRGDAGPIQVAGKAAVLVTDRPNIFVAGPSGSGKSTSLRNLDPKRTIILSTEMKALPFRGSKRFKMNLPINSLAQFQSAFSKALASDKADVVVVDSFTSLTEFTYAALIRSVERTGDRVMAAWASYKDTLHDILIQAKNSNKYVVFLGLDLMTQDDQQRIIRTIDVQGSLKGKIEKEFTVVFWTKVLEADAIEGVGQRYVFCTNSDGSNRAKSPMDMFAEQYIENDLALAIEHMAEYYNDEENDNE